MATDDNVCRALVLSGGGNNGSWQAGVFWGLVNYGDPTDYAYDVITGVSAGSINTLALAGWEKGTELELATWLSDLWKDLETSDIWKNYHGGAVQGTLLHQGALDNSPLLNYLQGVVAQFDDYKRRVTLSAVDVNTGEYTEFSQKDISLAELPDAAVSSASIPLIFPPHNWEGKGLFMDGGTVYNVNTQGAVEQCLDAGFTESQIVMDILICGNADKPV